MKEYTINRTLIIIMFVIISFFACNDNNCRDRIPKEIIEKSLGLILKDKKYQRIIYNEVKIERNNLLIEIEPFKVDTFKIEMINKLKENDIVYNHASSIDFYKFSKFSNGDIEVEFVIYPSKKYVRFCFRNKNKIGWQLIDREDWEF